MIRKDILQFLASIDRNVIVVAATKYVDVVDMKALLKNGINNFGENRVDSFLSKYALLGQNEDIVWHFIGHLQRNKAKQVINKIDYLHSLDSIELAKLISKERTSPLKVFVEVSINLEESKNGVPYFEAENFIKNIKDLPNIEIVGLMMMGIKNSSSIQDQFHSLKVLRDNIEKSLNISLPFLSMGMSDDYTFAIKEKATHIRLGRILYNL